MSSKNESLAKKEKNPFFLYIGYVTRIKAHGCGIQ